ncbi:protein ANTAGONIST OF LIKE HETEROCHROMATIN PROTEIN 1-like [Aricia agestis]|uniref:protein ANTAGONIST OF LIKE HETEROCHROMATIN PROTEIN 1-like n=1 Tax=Aricia agestis TaxID=91739 RepID=UPI001C20656A|nr:protein ANTAGONIST OF LIKE HETEROCHROMATIN PROTEIN 1-like [Aricia agestis]
MKNWLRGRESRSHMTLVRELRQSHQEDLFNYLRMSSETFNMLLTMVKPYISKMNTKMRQSINAEERLIATLRFLATGQSFEDLKFPTRISPQSLGVIIPETSKYICLVLKDCIKLPSSIEEWQEIARGYESRWHFPNCGGAIDGKHIRIRKPANSGSYYYNYKHYFSIVLMAIVNADYEFLYVDIGCNGRVSDGGVIEYTSFYNKLQNEQLNLPPNNMNKNNMNFVFVADDAFALHENVIKPYPQRNLTREERIFNYRLCRARRTVENAFGILSSRFRVLHTEINMKPEKIDYIVLALCCLHNLLKKKERAGYLPTQALVTEDLDFGRVVHGDLSEVNPLTSLQQGHSRNVCENAKLNRDKYKEYFMHDGAVSFQYNFVN